MPEWFRFVKKLNFKQETRVLRHTHFLCCVLRSAGRNEDGRSELQGVCGKSERRARVYLRVHLYKYCSIDVRETKTQCQGLASGRNRFDTLWLWREASRFCSRSNCASKRLRNFSGRPCFENQCDTRNVCL